MSPSAGASRVLVTHSNHEAFIVITAVLGMTWTSLVTIIRLYIRLYLNGPLGFDDAAAMFGAVVGILQTSLTLAAVSHGLGKSSHLLSEADIHMSLKLLYAASLLYVVAICSAKASMSFLLTRLTKTRGHLIAGHALTAFIFVWGIAAIFTVAFQCATPNPWDVSIVHNCQHMFARWVSVETISMATEVLISGGAMYLIWDLFMPFKLKLMVWGAFSAQLLIIIPTVFRIMFIHKLEQHSAEGIIPVSHDPTLSPTSLVITTQVVMHFCLMAATFPCMKQFLQAFDSRLGATTKLGTERAGNGYGSQVGAKGGFASSNLSNTDENDYALHNIDHGSAEGDTDYKMGPNHDSINQEPGAGHERYPAGSSGQNFRDDVGNTVTTVTTTNNSKRSFESDGSDQAIIKKSQVFGVSYETRNTNAYNS